MFDNIGRMIDPDFRRRRVASLLLVTLIGASGVGALTWGLRHVAAPPEAEEGWTVAMMEMAEPEPPMALPQLPAQGGSASAPGTAEPMAPKPTPPDDPPPLTPLAPKPLAPAAGKPNPSSFGDGIGEAGTGTGASKGAGNGDEPGSNCVGNCGQWFLHQELQLRRKPSIRYPEEARALNIGRQSCVAIVSIDDNGKPYDVRVSDCPAIFQQATRAGLLRWAWHPPRDKNRNKVKAQTRIRIHFQLR